MQIFVAVAGSGGTTAGAVALALSQSATSAALIELEGELGTRLFDRVGRRLILNDTGRALLPEARSMLQSAASIEMEFGVGADVRAYDLKLGASTTIANYILPSVVARFCERYPQAQVEIVVGNTGDIVTAVEEFAVDMGFIEGPCLRSSITVVPWMTDDMVIVCSPDHELARKWRKQQVPLQALRDARWLFREPGSGTRETVEHALAPHLQRLRSQMQLGSAESIKHAAAEGLGITCLSRHIVEDMLRLRQLVLLQTPLPKLRRDFCLIHQHDKSMTTGLRAFVAHCIATVSGDSLAVGGKRAVRGVKGLTNI
ncbi:MAG: LysR family transcriptional regulator [Casimicrobiaceae bacterium]